jgi:hypothetical protein
MNNRRVLWPGLLALVVALAAPALACSVFGVSTTGEESPSASTGGGRLEQWAVSASASSSYGEESWSPQAAIGEPDTYPSCGDIATAWASANSTGRDWLELVYATPVVPTEIAVYQTYNPGAIYLIEVIGVSGQSYEVYDVTPAPEEECPYILIVNVSGVSEKIDTVVLHLDQAATGSWNEIDAVRLTGDS